jgi:hypothetical protein
VILKRSPVLDERPEEPALLIAAVHCDFKGGFRFDDATMVMAKQQGRTA